MGTLILVADNVNLTLVAISQIDTVADMRMHVFFAPPARGLAKNVSGVGMRLPQVNFQK